ncbi:MAG TPA: Stp1/IreP family PP2C-type Ser/Thr phosphatase [Pseudacidobacterium sp.]|nr:Stp1/IreP family PP2C-type Ser/Thr phosphatase [Pseudacidobacterium sp.]
MTMRVEAVALTDVGRVRSANEDAYGIAVEAGLFIVCDGMGGAAAGEVASQIVVATALECIDKHQGAKEPRSLLEQLVTLANQRVFARAEREPSLHGMGTTLVSLFVHGDSVWVAHVGDSRCYRFNSGHLERITQDHSLVDEQVRLGQMTPAEAEMSPFRNVITRAVGTRATVTPDIDEVPAQSGDVFLLCSDGLTKELSEPQIAQILGETTSSDLQIVSQRLIDEANESGGADNITVVLVRIG